MDGQIGDGGFADLNQECPGRAFEPRAHPGFGVRGIHESGAAAQKSEIAQRLLGLRLEEL